MLLITITLMRSSIFATRYTVCQRGIERGKFFDPSFLLNFDFSSQQTERRFLYKNMKNKLFEKFFNLFHFASKIMQINLLKHKTKSLFITIRHINQKFEKLLRTKKTQIQISLNYISLRLNKIQFSYLLLHITVQIVTHVESNPLQT